MISLELVPKDEKELLQEAEQALNSFNEIEMINVPDVLRLPIRSYDAAALLLDNDINVVPHLRMIDRSSDAYLKIIEGLCNKGMTRVLLVSGDIPKDKDFSPSGLTPKAFCADLKKHFPELKVYGALDPYRSAMQTEINYMHEKIEVDFDGLFTQPFFSNRLLSLYLEQLTNTEVFVGISPVTSERNRNYWEKVNKVVLPPNYDFSLEKNGEKALELLKTAKEYKQHAYLMPITISSKVYLESMFEMVQS